jgi:hypothetical protein
MIFGRAGVAEFEIIKSSGNTSTLLSFHSCLINHSVVFIKRPSSFVASDIFTRDIHVLLIHWSMGRGDAHLLILQTYHIGIFIVLLILQSF